VPRDDESLLALEIDTIFGLQPGSSGRIRRLTSTGTGVAAVFDWSAAAQVLATDEPTATLVGPAELARARYEPARMPALVVALASRIARDVAGPVLVGGGPSFLLPPHLAAAAPAPLPVITSAGVGPPDRTDRWPQPTLVRPENWPSTEWHDLLAGTRGEWAMAIQGNEPVSICHTPAATATSVEAGVWTRTDHRGRGLAAATVRSWWACEQRHRRIGYYSTARDNWASRAVAAQLGLVTFGWLWTIRR
jgi:RimJ/RimL family protein N-acetyltransferase